MRVLRRASVVMSVVLVIAVSIGFFGRRAELLEARTTARREKNWTESDRIRDALTELGWTVKDTPEGPKLRKI